MLEKGLLIQYKLDLESRKLWKSIKDLEESDKDSELYCMSLTAKNIEKCFKMLEQGQSITDELEVIRMETEDYWYNDECDKSIVEVLKQFEFDDYQKELSEFIKSNVNWLRKDRDFEVYYEIKGGKLYSEIAERLGSSISTISKINKKVQSSLNNLKGRFFEIEFEKYLRDLNKFRSGEIVRNGAPGKPDIYITDNNNNLYVLSLKNLEIDKNPHTIIIAKLKPELEFALIKYTYGSFNKVELYLIVFDSLKERIHIRELDYKNPENINIYS